MNDFQISLAQKFLTEKEFNTFLQKKSETPIDSPIQFIKIVRDIKVFGLKEAVEIAKKVFPEVFFIVNVNQDSWENVVWIARSIRFSPEEKENFINAVHIVWGQTKSEEIKFHLK